MTDPAAPPHHWYAACRSQQLGEKPLAVTVLGRHLALFRARTKSLGAVLDRCPHRNAPLSQGWVRSDLLVCPYHGWEFDRAGQCQAIPGFCGKPSHATRVVPSFQAVEQDGLVWVYPWPELPPNNRPPRLDLLQKPGYASLVHDFTLEAGFVDALENFLDGTHTHFVHTGLVRTTSERRLVRAVIRRRTDRVEAEYVDEGRQSGLISRIFGAGITRSVGRFILPSTAQLEYWAGERLRLQFTLYFTPETPTTQRVFAVLVGDPAPLPVWLVTIPLTVLLWRVVRQDQRILALQSQNLRRFGEPHFASTEVDLLRPHIVRLLQGGPTTSEPTTERVVTLML
jgi:phenylpropionate dioxygenase-like ring-hydroxylating dioxygenase large terminal subunit